MELKELIKKIEQWAIGRELDKKATVEAQSIKTAEEMAELIIGISKDNIDLIKDSIGDVFVTLVIGNMIDEKLNMEEIVSDFPEVIDPFPKRYMIHNISCSMNSLTSADRGYRKSTISLAIMRLAIVCYTYNLEFTDCIESAYNEIKDRKGKTVNGQFIKEADLW